MRARTPVSHGDIECRAALLVLRVEVCAVFCKVLHDAVGGLRGDVQRGLTGVVGCVDVDSRFQPPETSRPRAIPPRSRSLWRKRPVPRPTPAASISAVVPFFCFSEASAPWAIRTRIAATSPFLAARISGVVPSPRAGLAGRVGASERGRFQRSVGIRTMGEQNRQEIHSAQFIGGLAGPGGRKSRPAYSCPPPRTAPPCRWSRRCLDRRLSRRACRRCRSVR